MCVATAKPFYQTALLRAHVVMHSVNVNVTGKAGEW